MVGSDQRKRKYGIVYHKTAVHFKKATGFSMRDYRKQNRR